MPLPEAGKKYKNCCGRNELNKGNMVNGKNSS